jgi:hypothetical protein
MKTHFIHLFFVAAGIGASIGVPGFVSTHVNPYPGPGPFAGFCRTVMFRVPT